MYVAWFTRAFVGGGPLDVQPVSFLSLRSKSLPVDGLSRSVFSPCSGDCVVCICAEHRTWVFRISPKPHRFKLRNSLFITACISFSLFCHAWVVPLQQPMRTPAQTSINIIEKEDVAGKRIQAKYHAMENQEFQWLCDRALFIFCFRHVSRATDRNASEAL